MWWNRASAVSRAVGRPLSGINLQALDNWSTAMRIQVKPSELGRLVTKLTSTWDHGWQGIGRGTNFPTGRWRGGAIWASADIQGDTWPYRATSTELVGAREYAGCLDVQSPGKREWSPEGWITRRWVHKSSHLGQPGSQLAEGGDTDLFLQSPLDGADENG